MGTVTFDTLKLVDTVPSYLRKPIQTERIYLNGFAADFLLHRGRFHLGLATQASAFLSTG